MQNFLMRLVLIPAFVAGLAIPATADDGHHPENGETRPGTPRGAMPGGGMMMPGMEGMMRGMMARMPDRAAADRRRMIGLGPTMMGGMGMMRARAIEHVDGHVAFLKAELGITEAQQKVWDDFAAAVRENVRQINAWHAEQARDEPDDRSPLTVLARREAALAMQQQVVRRTKPALEALHETLSDRQKASFATLVGSDMGRSRPGRGPRGR